MESNNVIYRSEKYTVLAEEIYSDIDGTLFELRLILNVLEETIDSVEAWCGNIEHLKITFSMMNDARVIKTFNKEDFTCEP